MIIYFSISSNNILEKLSKTLIILQTVKYLQETECHRKKVQVRQKTLSLKKKKKITNIAKWLKIFANQNTVPPSGFKVRDRSRFSYISYTLVFILYSLHQTCGRT